MMKIFRVTNKARYSAYIVANHPDEALEYALKTGTIKRYENGTVKDVTEHYYESPDGKGLRIPNIIKRQKSLDKVLNENKIGGICLLVDKQEYEVISYEEILGFRRK